MAIVSVPATKSITVSSKFPNKSFRKENIIIGCRNGNMCYSYVFFDTSFVPSDHMQSATLVLFKTSEFFFTGDITYYIMPLLRPFSSFTTYNRCNSDSFDLSAAVKFCPLGKDVAVQIDITTIVNKWFNNILPNCGLVIAGYRVASKGLGRMSFGSAYSKDNTLIPVINMSYRQNIFCLLPPPLNVTYAVKAIEKKQ